MRLATCLASGAGLLFVVPCVRAQTAPPTNDAASNTEDNSADAGSSTMPATAAGDITPTPRGKTKGGARGNVANGNQDIVKTAQEGPIDIASTGETTYNSTPQGRIATATSNVNIQTNDASIFADYAEYNLDTHEALLIGNVRI